MADTVQYLLESSIPELDDLHSRGLFSKAELRQIVKKRSHFEYLLKRRTVLLPDYLRYIEYEMQVEKLRQFRKKSQGEDAVHGVADTAGVRRLHFIYTRALRKFKGDLRLWHAYLSFCKSSGATKRLDRALTQALQLHSGTPALWVYAASWEVQKRQDMDAARALLSRGLRSCPESTKLWHEYFRLELVYALRLRERRDALGLAGGVMQHEALLTDDPAKALLLAGGVARVVHKQALAALPQAPVAFHTGFLDVLASLPVPFADVEAAVLTALGATFPNDAEAWHERARWAMAQAAAGRQQEEAAEAAATRVYEDGVAAAPSVALYDFFTEFLMQRRRMAADAGDAQRAEALQQRATAALAAAAAAGLRSPSAAVRHADALVAVGDVAAAAAVLTAVCESDVSHGGCTSEAAWGARLRLAARTAAAQSTAGADRTSEDLVAAVGRLCVRALRTVPPAQASPLWAQAMQLHTALRLDAAPLLALLESQLTATCTPLGDVAAMAVEWLSLHAGLEQARRLYGTLLTLPRPSLELVFSAARLERADAEAAVAGTDALPDYSRARGILHQATAVYGESSTALWLALAQCEREGKATAAAAAEASRPQRGAGQVYWQALKRLAEPTEFITTYKALT